jgi:hypothetical protein
VATSFVANNVSSGTYYVRLRATNANGVSGPSNEIVLVVGSTPPARFFVDDSIDADAFAGYFFITPISGIATVTLIWGNSAVNLDLYLTDGTCTRYPPLFCTILASSSRSSGTFESLAYPVRQGTKYVTWVDNFSFVRQTFHIDVVVTPTPSATNSEFQVRMLDASEEPLVPLPKAQVDPATFKKEKR